MNAPTRSAPCRSPWTGSRSIAPRPSPRPVRDRADWIEVGTSLVKRYGMTGVARIVAAAGGTPVLADLKTADDARTEFAMAADAGARIGHRARAWLPPATLDVAVRVAAERGLELMVDLMELDAAGRARVAAAHAGHRRARRARAQGRADRRHRRRGACSARGPPAAGWRWPAASASPTFPRWRGGATSG